MTLRGKYALVTGGSRGIGRGIALKLGESGAKVAVHYYQKEDQAKATLEKLRACGSDGFVLQADVCKPEEIRRMIVRVKSEFGALDIFVNNARPEVATFYEGPMTIRLDMFDFAIKSQAKAFLVGVQEAVPMLRDRGRIIAMTYAPGGRFGSWQPWVAMGAAKAALEVLCRYFARHSGRPRKCRRAALLRGSQLDHGTNPGCGWRRLAHGCAPPTGNSASARGERRPRRLAGKPSKTRES